VLQKDDRDAFGRQLLDYWNGSGGDGVVERDDGYVEVHYAEPYFAEYGDWSPEEKLGMGFVAGRVLDVGCGSGRHALHLQELGFDVVGLDNSPCAVETCRQRGVKNVLLGDVNRMRHFGGSFDTVLFLGNNFGVLGSPPQAARTLGNLYRATGPGGRIVLQTLDPYRTGNPFHHAYHERNRSRGRLCGQVRIRVRYMGYCSRWFDYLFVSPPELKAIVGPAGWRVAKLLRGRSAIYVAVLSKRRP
jgi:SAM-dependent methyltransferase